MKDLGVTMGFFVDSVSETKENRYLSISQGKAIIKLTEKKNRDKRLINNSDPFPISLYQKLFQRN